MFPNLNTVNQIAFDSETSGLDRKDVIVGYVLTWSPRPEDSVYLPIRHKGGANLEVGPTNDYIRNLFLRPDLRVIMHNAAFDMKMLAKEGIEILGPVEDTQINAALINENMRSFSLGGCCTYMGVQEKKGDALYAHLAQRFGGEAGRDQMANFHLLAGDDPIGTEYATGDGTSTLQLREAQHRQLEAQDLKRVWEVECRLIKTLHRSHLRGVRVAVDRLDDVQEQIEDELVLATAEIDNISAGSGKQVQAWLEEQKERGETVPPWPRTKPTKRHPQGSNSFPSKYLQKFPVGQKVSDVRSLTKLSDGFLTPLKEKHLRGGNIIYPSFSQTKSDSWGTVTGRLSSFDPNMQQVPKRNKRLGKLFRQVFLPPEGMVWHEQDYKSAEYRMFAHFANSQALLDGFNLHGLDLHDVVEEMLGVDRDFAKNMNFGLLFGMGDNSLAGHLGVTKAQAIAYRAEYFRRIPEAKVMMDKASAICRKFGYVRTVMGRRRRFPDPRNQDYQAINAICQGSIGDVMKLKMVEVEDYLMSEGEGLYGFSVHDANNFFAPEGNTKIPAEVKRISEDFENAPFTNKLRVKIPVDGGAGVNWARASYKPEDWKEAA